THEGVVLGTCAYLPPEQARGEVGGLDERSDVFSLGAVLCELLTGQPPYTGEDWEAVWDKARRANRLDRLGRLDRGGAHAELTLLAERCLSAVPAGRPRDAGEVAEAVSAYQAGVEERARKADRERAAAEARAEEAKAKATAAAERRARRLTVGLAGAA